MNIGLDPVKQMSNECDSLCEKCNLYQIVCHRYVDNIRQRLCGGCLHAEKSKYKYEFSKYGKHNLL